MKKVMRIILLVTVCVLFIFETVVIIFWLSEKNNSDAIQAKTETTITLAEAKELLSKNIDKLINKREIYYQSKLTKEDLSFDNKISHVVTTDIDYYYDDNDKVGERDCLFLVEKDYFYDRQRELFIDAAKYSDTSEDSEISQLYVRNNCGDVDCRNITFDNVYNYTDNYFLLEFLLEKSSFSEIYNNTVIKTENENNFTLRLSFNLLRYLAKSYTDAQNLHIDSLAAIRKIVEQKATALYPVHSVIFHDSKSCEYCKYYANLLQTYENRYYQILEKDYYVDFYLDKNTKSIQSIDFEITLLKLGAVAVTNYNNDVYYERTKFNLTVGDYFISRPIWAHESK